MYSLEVIKAMNAAIPETASRPTTPGWIVKGENGMASVFDPTGKKVAEVNVSDPLEDSDLVRFHREWTGPEYVARNVESYASQWRRIIVTTPAWAECKRRESERYKRRDDDPVGHWLWPAEENAPNIHGEGECQRHTVGLIIPRQVAPPQSPLPFHQAKGGCTQE